MCRPSRTRSTWRCCPPIARPRACRSSRRWPGRGPSSLRTSVASRRWARTDGPGCSSSPMTPRAWPAPSRDCSSTTPSPTRSPGPAMTSSMSGSAWSRWSRRSRRSTTRAPQRCGCARWPPPAEGPTGPSDRCRCAPGRLASVPMSLARLWTFLAVALPVLASLLVPLSTVDLAYHLRAGAEILDARALPTVDTWTFTAAGLPWVDQQWGAQVILHGVYAGGGWTGLAIVRALLIGVVFGGLFAISRRSGVDVRLAAVLTLVAFVVAVPALALRPQLLGMVCFVLAAWLVAIRRETPRALWLVPVVVAVWANLHGSFFLGPILVGLAWLQDLHDGDPAARRVLITA